MEEKTDWFFKQLDFSIQHNRYRDCSYYFCHKTTGQELKELNCFFCYCPFYPCRNKIGNGSWIQNQEGKKIWDCTNCTFIHRDRTVKTVLEMLYSGKNYKQIGKILAEEKKKAGKNL